jgi:flavorubredoxin
MNHAEPDHAGAIPYLLKLNDKAKLVCTKIGAQAAKTYFKVPEERIMIVKDNDVLELGNKTLKFIEAPMLHWPETCSPT